MSKVKDIYAAANNIKQFYLKLIDLIIMYVH